MGRNLLGAWLHGYRINRGNGDVFRPVIHPRMGAAGIVSEG